MNNQQAYCEIKRTEPYPSQYLQPPKQTELKVPQVQAKLNNLQQVLEDQQKIIEDLCVRLTSVTLVLPEGPSEKQGKPEEYLAQLPARINQFVETVKINNDRLNRLVNSIEL